MFCDEVGYELVAGGVEVAVLGVVVAVAVSRALDVVEEVDDFDVAGAACFGEPAAGAAALRPDFDRTAGDGILGVDQDSGKGAADGGGGVGDGGQVVAGGGDDVGGSGPLVA